VLKDVYFAAPVVGYRPTTHIAVKLFQSISVSAVGHAKQEAENTSEMSSTSNNSNRQCS
jgi:hypothetical protein